MWRSVGFVCLVASAAGGVFLQSPVHAQGASSLGGIWTLNRSLSESPPEIGFNPDFLSSSREQGGASNGGSRGRRGGGTRGSAGGFVAPPPESAEDAQRLRLLTGEVRNPPVRLMIVDTPATFTITNELGQSRAVHPTGKEESLEIEHVPFTVTTTRDRDRLVAVYHVEEGRSVRYTYSRSANPPQLIVEVELLGRGGGDKARRVYEPGSDSDTMAPRTISPPAGVPASAATGQRPQETFDQRPGAELRGLKSLGILVEDLGTQAVACGLNHDAIEAAVSKRLTDAGFAVRKNSDEDTYVYVNVMSTAPSAGTCVSRYDAFLYTQATANLTYRDRPVLVQVSLIHRGSIATGAAAVHPAAVTRGLESFIDLFITQIRDANK